MLPLITGSTGAIVVLALVAYLFYIGKLHSDSEMQKLIRENEDLKEALASERRAVDEAMRTGTVTNQLISALTQIAEHRQGTALPSRHHELTGEDLGL